MVAVDGAPVRRDVVLAGGARLQGTVRAADDEPLAGALLTLTDPRGDVVASTASADSGRYELTELVAGTYTLAGRAPGHQPAAVTVELGEGVTDRDLVLAGGARVAGVVRAVTDDRPLPDATVSLLDDTGAVVATQVTGEKGEYRFDDLLAGTYTLVASGFAPVAAGLRVEPGTLVEHDVTLGGDDGTSTGPATRSADERLRTAGR
jgi:uncharacterized surface anchored protein